MAFDAGEFASGFFHVLSPCVAECLDLGDCYAVAAPRRAASRVASWIRTGAIPAVDIFFPDYAQSSSGSLSVEKSDPLGQKATAEPVRKRNQTPGGTPDLRGKAAVFLQHELVESEGRRALP